MNSIKWRFNLGVLLVLFSFPLWIISENGIDISSFIIPLICILQFYLIYRLKNVPMFLIFTLYSFLYFIYLIPHFYWGTDLSEHTTFQKHELFIQVLFEFYLFYTGLILSTARNYNPNQVLLKEQIRIPCEKWKKKIFLIILFTIFLKVITQGENVINSNNPYQVYMENLDSNSALPMFLLLFMIFIYFIFENKKIRNYIYLLFFTGFVFYTITRGYRVLIAPLGFLFFFLYCEGKIKVKSIILLFILGFIGMIGINALKMGMNFEWKYLFSESDDYILSHHADNLYVSATGLGLVENGSIGIYERILLNIGFFLESIIPPAFLPTEMKYPLIISKYTTNGGGGLCLGGAYLMWGYVGILLFSYLLGEFIRKSYITSNTSWKFISIIVLIYSANWFSYDFHVILRFSLLGYIIYKLFIIVKFNGQTNTYCK